MIENRNVRRLIGAVTFAGLIALAYILPPMPIVFVVLGYLWALYVILPEVYGV